MAVISAGPTRPLVRPRLRLEPASSPRHASESGSSSYGLLFRLGLLPSPPRGNAVTSGYLCYDFSDKDFHLADNASSRTHGPPLSRGDDKRLVILGYIRPDT